MIYLLLAIVSSALISVVMRLSEKKITGNVAMLAMNYVTCLVVASAYAGFELLPASPALPQTLAMGTVHGALFLCSFVLLQRNIQKSGVVLSSLFQRLGLLVSLAAAVLLFGELPTPLQAVGFVLALGAIVLINTGKDTSFRGAGAGLLALLVLGGLGDAMSKVFETWGDTALAPQFLAYTFGTALVLCVGLMLYKKQRPGWYELLFGVLIGIPNFFSARFLLRALESLAAVIVYPTFSVGTILVVTLAGVVLFGEKLSRRQWAALGVILAALVLLNI